MDIGFEKVTGKLDLVTVNTSAARDHVAEIERGIRWIKVGSHSMVAGILFKFLYKQVALDLAYFAVIWRNIFPAAKGISEQ